MLAVPVRNDVVGVAVPPAHRDVDVGPHDRLTIAVLARPDGERIAGDVDQVELGFNDRMSNVLAGIGRGQLRVLEQRVGQRRARDVEQLLPALVAEDDKLIVQRARKIRNFLSQPFSVAQVMQSAASGRASSRPLEISPPHLAHAP